MEDRTKFNLNQKIDSWKIALSKSGAMTNDNILELESHLLDEIDQLKTQSLSEEECFLIAKKRIGDFDFLKLEYGKVNEGRFLLSKMEPYFKGVLVFLLFLSISSMLFYLLAIIGQQLPLAISSNIIGIGTIGVLIIMLAVLFLTSYGRTFLSWMNKGLALFVSTSLIMVIEFYLRTIASQYFGMSTFGTMSMTMFWMEAIIIASVFIGSIVVIFKNKSSNKLSLKRS